MVPRRIDGKGINDYLGVIFDGNCNGAGHQAGGIFIGFFGKALNFL
jgi:hypothetical protein